MILIAIILGLLVGVVVLDEGDATPETDHSDRSDQARR